MNCKCVETINGKLKQRHLSLNMHVTIDTETFEMGRALALETVSLKKGVKPVKCFMPFCPFCGKKN